MYKSFIQNIKALIKTFLTVFDDILSKLIKHENTKLTLKEKKVEFVKNEEGIFLCDGCGLCQKVCPGVGIINIEKNNEEINCSLNTNQCILCGQCIEICPQKALNLNGVTKWK